jgi:hypothetical protein
MEKQMRREYEKKMKDKRNIKWLGIYPVNDTG